ncbi:MAG: hypothetical protein ABI824_05110 [Acidobacteriota bacterium]
MIDYIARQEFLRAIDSEWEPSPLGRVAGAVPDVDAWLDTLPEFMRLPKNPQGEILAWQKNLENPVWPFRWSALESDLKVEAVAARRAVHECLSIYPLPQGAEWLRDVVIHTIAYRKIQRAEILEWAYSPDIPIKPASISVPYKDLEADFVNIARRMWRRRNKEISSKLSLRRTNTKRDIKWLVRWLNGESDSQMASSRFDDGTIRRARARIAERVGFTLAETLAARDDKGSQKRVIAVKPKQR